MDLEERAPLFGFPESGLPLDGRANFFEEEGGSVRLRFRDLFEAKKGSGMSEVEEEDVRP